MNYTQMIGGLDLRFHKRGRFDLLPGESINDVVRREAVPNEFGVYVIHRDLGCTGPVLYIGKAGTFRQDGSRRQQGISKRLTMKQDGMFRRRYFPKIICEMGLKGLSFAWFVTCYEALLEPPALVEAELLTAYLEQYSQLPALNKAF